jgi:hypothetical protein
MIIRFAAWFAEHPNKNMENWNDGINKWVNGIMQCWAKKQKAETHYSIIPLFQYSNGSQIPLSHLRGRVAKNRVEVKWQIEKTDPFA